MGNKKFRAQVQLVVAGGYDERVRENVEYYEELHEICRIQRLNTTEYPCMKGDVVFLKSFNETERGFLFKSCSCILYTPENEHFGIVPVEAMYMRKPVIAVSSGGPLESIKHNKTGLLCASDPLEFANAIHHLLADPKRGKSMGKHGHQRAISLFSIDAFLNCLEAEMNQIKDKPLLVTPQNITFSLFIIAVLAIWINFF